MVLRSEPLWALDFYFSVIDKIIIFAQKKAKIADVSELTS